MEICLRFYLKTAQASQLIYILSVPCKSYMPYCSEKSQKFFFIFKRDITSEKMEG